MGRNVRFRSRELRLECGSGSDDSYIRIRIRERRASL